MVLKMKRLGFLVLFSICFLHVFADDNSIQFNGNSIVNSFLANYVTTFYNTSSNGFPRNEANTVLQTQDGFVWFGGFDGLIRYDGRRFTQWNAVTPDNFTSSSVRSLYESIDEEGISTLWIGTNDKGLFSYRNGLFTVYDMSMGAPSSMIRSITMRADGMIFCGTSDGLFYIDPEGKIIIAELDTDLYPFIVSVSADAENNIFLVKNSGELLVYTKDGKTVQYPYGSRFTTVRVFGSLIFAGTQSGDAIIFSFNEDRFITEFTRQTANLYISSFYEDSRGLIWITSETGIGFLDASLEYHHIGDPNGAGFYSGIIEDYQNGYWITALRGGVVKFSVSAFTDLNVLHNYPTGSANAVVIHNGITYIGTDNNLYILDTEGRPAFTSFSDLFNGRRVRGIFRDSRNDIWICTYSDLGTVRFTPQTGEFISFTPDNGLASDRSRSFTELPNGVVVIGTAAGVSFIQGDRVISAMEAFGSNVPELQNLPATMILSLCVTPDKTLFIGTDGSGIYIVNSEGITRLREEDGLSSGVILRMAVNPETKGVWVSPSGGLYYIDTDRQVHVIEKIPPHAFLDIIHYNEELILTTSLFLIRTNPLTLLDPDIPFTPVQIGRTSGLSSPITPNAWNWIAGSDLYLCVESGIFIYDFERTMSAAIPRSAITKIEVDDLSYEAFSGTINIPPNAFRLTLELAYLSFGLLDNALMYYMLEGQDTEKQLLLRGDSSEVSYTNLDGGNYTFITWTEDLSGNIGSFSEIHFYKELKLLEYPIIWVLIISFGVIIIAVIFNLIYREKMRVHGLAMENASLDRVNRLKSDFMQTISHEMRTPLAVISGFAEITAEAVRENITSNQMIENHTAQNLETIAGEAKRMADMMEEMRQLSLAKDSPKDRHPLDPGAVITQIANLYAKVLERKGIALKLKIAGKLPPIYANENELTQVLFNILRNAETHTEGGTIAVLAENLGSFVRVKVYDSGSGIAPNIISKVFEHGFHGTEGGSGYGLAICRDIINAHDGEIGIQSKPGKGTIVTFTLPVIMDKNE